VLCYDATALPEIVTPEVGEVVPEGDIRAVAEACARLCESPKDPQACRARAAEYEKRRQFSQYVGLYEEVLAQAGNRRNEAPAQGETPVHRTPKRR
jgi:glycosyltransferase involved in cell wall biosynthesis